MEETRNHCTGLMAIIATYAVACLLTRRNHKRNTTQSKNDRRKMAEQALQRFGFGLPLMCRYQEAHRQLQLQRPEVLKAVLELSAGKRSPLFDDDPVMLLVVLLCQDHVVQTDWPAEKLTDNPAPASGALSRDPCEPFHRIPYDNQCLAQKEGGSVALDFFRNKIKCPNDLRFEGFLMIVMFGGLCACSSAEEGQTCSGIPLEKKRFLFFIDSIVTLLIKGHGIAYLHGSACETGSKSYKQAKERIKNHVATWNEDGARSKTAYVKWQSDASPCCTDPELGPFHLEITSK